MSTLFLYGLLGFGCLAGAVLCQFMVRWQIRHGIDPDNPNPKK